MKFKDFFTWKAFTSYGVFGIASYLYTDSFILVSLGLASFVAAFFIYFWDKSSR